MSMHATLGIEYPDGTIQGCYVHWGSEHMIPTIEDYIHRHTTTSLAILIAKAQAVGGIRSFHAQRWVDFANGKQDFIPETDLCDDPHPYIINEDNWDENHFGNSFSYLVNYETGNVKMRRTKT